MSFLGFLKGKQGPPGPSNYEWAVAKGLFKGSEAEFLASLKCQSSTGTTYVPRRMLESIPATGIDFTFLGETIIGTPAKPVTDFKIIANMAGMQQFVGVFVNYKGPKVPVFDDNFTVEIDESNYDAVGINVIQIWPKLNAKGGVIAAITV